MMRTSRTLHTTLLLGLLSFTAACLAADKPTIPMNTADDPMITHRIGRFTVKVPLSMKVAIRTSRLRHRDLEESLWPQNVSPDQSRNNAWSEKLAQIDKITPPDGKTKALDEVRGNLGQNLSAVSYYGDRIISKMLFWDVLVSAGQAGVWIKWKGKEAAKERALGVNLDIARSYRPFAPDAPLPKENWFYLEHGAIALPYLEQERTYSRFEGHPLNVKLEIETNEIHKDEPEGENLSGRLAAVLGTGFATGVNIEKIRTGKRTVGGLHGEETVLRADDKKKVSLSFMWRYPGKKDSGEYPEIIIEIDTRDGQLDEKLKLWDAILNSFKPAGQ